MKINTKKAAAAAILVTLSLGVFFALRSTYVSNYLKRFLLAEFERQTGYQLAADRLYLNLFPFYVGAREVMVIDERGNKLLKADGVKAYIYLPALLRRTVHIRRVAFKEPNVWLDPEQIRHLRRLVAARAPTREGFRVKLGTLAVSGGSLYMSDPEKGLRLSAEGLGGEAALGEAVDIMVSSRKVLFAARGVREIGGSLVAAVAQVRRGAVKLKRLSMTVEGSKLGLQGTYSKDKGASLTTDLDLMVASVRKVLGLKSPGEGRLSVKGDVKLADFGRLEDTLIDLRVKGEFRIETLLEAVGARERISGLASVDARLKGPVSDFAGEGEGTLKKANIYGLLAERLDFGVNWSHGVLSFREIRGSVYGGKARAEVSLNLPRVTDFNIRVNVSDASTTGFLGFLKHGLPVPEGKLSGDLHSTGRRFMPYGRFRHETTRPGADAIGRIKSIEGDYQFVEGGIALKNLVARTALTEAKGGGMVYTEKETLDIAVNLKTGDIGDLTRPYFAEASGRGEFSGGVSGPLSNLVIDGRVSLAGAKIKGYDFGEVSGEFIYRKSALSVHSLSARVDDRAVTGRGEIAFPSARGLFEFKNPVYDLTADVKQAPLRTLMKLVGAELPLEGLLTAKVRLKGRGPSIGGTLKIDGASYRGYSFDMGEGEFAYENGVFRLSDALLKKSGSSLRLTGSAGSKDFEFRAFSDNLRLSEVVPYGLPADYRVSALRASGRGTFDEPELRAEGRLSAGTIWGRPVQGGQFRASLKGKSLEADLSLYGNKLLVKGAATLRGEVPWKASLEVRGGRFDPFVAGFLKDVPEDLFITLQGRGEFSGTKSSIGGIFRAQQLSAAAYGQSFTLDREAALSLRDKMLKLEGLSLRGGQASISIDAEAVIGKSINLNAVGKASLAPLKAFVKGLSVASGEADFVLHVGGRWERPDFSGGLKVNDSVLGFRGLPQMIRIAEAYAYVDEDRLVVEEFSGAMGGGEIGMTGVAYLEGFRPRRFFFDVLVNNVSTAFRDGTASFNGNLVFRGDTSRSSLAGELFVKKASYKKRVDWKEIVFKRKRPPAPRAGLFAATQLNVRLYGSDNIIVDNNIARASLRGDITLRGTPSAPVPVGRVEALRGKVFFRNTEFNIEHASIIFTDPVRINPTLNILATSVVQGYKIRVNISGTPDRFNLALTSDPALEETKILSLLTIGDFGEGIRGVEGGIGAAEATSFITGQFENVVSERLKGITGFDRFQIDPYISKKTGAVTPRVTVSKRLIGEKLYVTYAAPIGVEEEQIIKLEYSVTPNMALVGLRDERGSVGGDVKFRFEFR